MLNTRYVLEHIEEIRKSLEKRKSDYPIDELLQLDEKSKGMHKQIQELREKRNKGSREIADLTKSGEKVDRERIEELGKVRESIDQLENDVVKYDSRIESLLWNMPNILHESVPYGVGDEGNVEIRKVGTPMKRAEPRHNEVLEKLDMLNLEQAAKVAGARFYYLKGDLVLLEQSLIRFAIDTLVAKGYTALSPPFMLKREYYRHVTALGDFEEALYVAGEAKEAEQGKDLEKIEDELFLISTSEHPTAALHADTVFSVNELPKKYVAVSPCFRREAGSHGKDTKGIFRVHQFYKVEQFVITKEEDSWKMHEELLSNAEEIFNKLNIPYRVVNICTGDIGIVAAKKYDLEAYMPAQDTYREMVSCSNCTDWQSLRLGMRYDEGKERKYAHTLNCTALATTRAIVAIIENYLNDDGTVTIPDVLVPYMNGKSKLGR